MKYCLHFSFSLFLCLSIRYVQAQQVDTTMWVTNGPIHAIVRNGNDIYLGGEFSYIGPNTGGGAIVNKIDGSLLPLPLLHLGGSIHTSAPDGKGGWYVGGTFTQIQGISCIHLAHILPSGYVDVNWKPNPNSYVNAITVSGNTVFVSGSFTTIGTQNRKYLAAIDGTTGQATTWNPTINGDIKALKMVDNTLYIGGSFTSVDGQIRNNLVAFDLTNGQVNSWDPNANSVVFSLDIFNGQVFIGGGFSTINGQSKKYLAAVDATTGQVSAWSPQLDQYVLDVAISGNTLYVTGIFTSVGDIPRNGLAAIDATTGQATTWNPAPNIYAIKVRVSGKTIFLAGGFTNIGGQPRDYLAAVDAVTGKATAWNPIISGNISGLEIFGETVFIGGDFSSTGGQKRNGLAAIDATTGQATAWNPGLVGYVKALAVSGNAIYIGGGFSQIGGQIRNNVASFDLVSKQVAAWNPNVNSTVNTLDILNNTVYIGGYFTSVGGQSRPRIAAISMVTGQATPWNPQANNYVASIKATSSTIYAGGNFTSVGGQSRNYLAALDSNTGQATTWNPDVNNTVSAFALSKSSLYVGGNFTKVGGKDIPYLASIDVVTGGVSPWNANANNQVNTIEIIGNTIYVGGRFNTIGGKSRNQLAAVDVFTGQVAAWDPGLPKWNNSVYKLLFYNDILYVGGSIISLYDRFVNFAVFKANTPLPNYVKGDIFEDIDGDCVKQADEKGMANRIVVAQPGNYFASTDSTGAYTLAVNTGIYTIQQIIPSDQVDYIQPICPVSPTTHLVEFTGSNQTYPGKDFANRIVRKRILKVSVSSTRRRRCFASNTTISYSNLGNADADSVKVYLKLPKHVRIVRANVGYVLDKENNYIFSIGKLTAGKEGQIIIQDSVVCDNPSIRGLTQCTKAWITPANERKPDPNWDRSDVLLKSVCLDNGFVRLGIYNTGLGNMADSSLFRIYLDAQLAFQKHYQLSKGDSLIMRVPVNGRTLRLEADQRPGHPSKQQSTITMEGCGTTKEGIISKGFVSQFPPDEEELEVDVECLPIIDSYDPNDKIVSPQGVSAEKYTPTHAELEYTIRFQNTGTDVAYRVVVIDTVSEYLDISTLRITGATHRYTLNISGKGKPVLTWTFANINLPDSTTNNLGSNGAVHFSIRPKTNLPEKTHVENFADIFFDYNEPVRTNTTLNTLYDIPPAIVPAVQLDQAVICGPANATVFAGIDRTLCGQDTVQLEGSISVKGLGKWTRIKGAGVIQQVNNPASRVTSLSIGENIFEWVVPVHTCSNDSLKAQVTITTLLGLDKPMITFVDKDSIQCNLQGENYQWHLNGNPLSANTRTIHLSQQGYYTVQVNSVKCHSPISEVYQYILTAIEPAHSGTLHIYPNPNLGHFTVELSSQLGVIRDLSILDALGKIVFSRSGHSSEPINLSNSSNGIYFLKVHTDRGVYVQRVVKH